MFADEVYEKFSKLIGSTEVATRAALRFIENLCLEYSPQSLIEIGCGIGTISELLAKVTGKSAVIYGYEKNSWCREQLKLNSSLSKVRLHSKLEDLILNIPKNVDLIIIDDWMSKSETDSLILKANPKVIFIEGHRRRQQYYVAKSLKYQEFKYETFSGYEDSYKGGATFFLDSIETASNRNIVLVRLILRLCYSKIIEIRSRIPIRRILRIN